MVKRPDLPVKKSEKNIEEILELLPSFNCGSCGYNSCMDYAKAISTNKEDINKCRPGGKELLKNLEEILS